MKLFTLLVFIGALWLHSGQWNFHFIGVLGSWNIGCCMLFICDCYLCCTLVAFWQWKFSLYWCFGSWNIGCCTQLPVGGTLWSPNKYWWLLVILMKENENCMNLWALVWIKCRFKRCYFWITANMTGIFREGMVGVNRRYKFQDWNIRSRNVWEFHKRLQKSKTRSDEQTWLEEVELSWTFSLSWFRPFLVQMLSRGCIGKYCPRDRLSRTVFLDTFL